ncbi:hypothetical protein [Streptomyces sp. NPDC092307]|uniref:hypothetical protein n=1 Tax=Streptomyces sp. NPDC092307 TaxID=3366013 RepID=UPI00380E331E
MTTTHIQQNSDTIDAQAAAQGPAQAQQLTRLRRQRDALFLLLLLGLGAVFALAAGLFVRLAPSWADPAATALGTGAVYVAVATLVVPYLLRHR